MAIKYLEPESIASGSDYIILIDKEICSDILIIELIPNRVSNYLFTIYLSIHIIY